MSNKGTYILIMKAENEFDCDAKSHLFYFEDDLDLRIPEGKTRFCAEAHGS